MSANRHAIPTTVNDVPLLTPERTTSFFNLRGFGFGAVALNPFVASCVVMCAFMFPLLCAVEPAHAFDCSPAYCTQMSSCAEAHHKLTVCGHSKRDADNDGIPCEDLCGKDRATYAARVKAQTGKALADTSPALSLIGPAEASEADASSQTFSCGGKRYCKHMVSCDEAKFYLRTCGVRSLDGDGDGVPCNRLCR